MGQAGAGCVLFALHANEGRAWSKSKKGCTWADVQQVSLAGLEVAQVSSQDTLPREFIKMRPVNRTKRLIGRNVPSSNKKWVLQHQNRKMSLI